MEDSGNPTTGSVRPAHPPDEVLQCPLCGATYTRESLDCHHGCPISHHCGVLCCPHCGYETVDTSDLEERLRRWWLRLTRPFRRARPGTGSKPPEVS